MDLASELAQHPALTYTVLAGLVALILFLLRHGLTKIERKLVDLTKRANKLEERNHQRDTGSAIVTKELKSIHDAISSLSTEMKTLSANFSDFRLINEVSHADIINTQERLNDRLSAVESRMPNGELKRLADAFEKLARENQ